MSLAIFVHGHVSLMSQQEKKNFSCNTTPPSETCCHGSFNVKKVLAVVAVGLSDFSHVYIGLGRACKPMVHMTKGDPAVVVGAAAVRDGAAKCQVCFCTEVALAVGARRFVVASDLAVATEGGFVAEPY